MIITYDIEVLKYDWIMVFKEANDYRVIHNNVKELEAYIDTLNKNKSILVGFNNYHYDDVVLAGVLLGKDPYEISKKLIAGERVNYKLNMITLDVMQELPLGVGLKSSQANLGMSIVETPIDFNFDEQLTKDEVNLFIDLVLRKSLSYLLNIVKTTLKILRCYLINVLIISKLSLK